MSRMPDVAAVAAMVDHDDLCRNGYTIPPRPASSNYYTEIKDDVDPVKYYDQASRSQLARQIQLQHHSQVEGAKNQSVEVRLPTSAGAQSGGGVTCCSRRRCLIVSVVALVLLLLAGATAATVLLIGSTADNGGTPTPTTQLPKENDRCILLIGGNEDDVIEYYNPDNDVDCSTVGRISTDGLKETFRTSGCYLSDSRQILIREALPKKPPMLYELSQIGVAPASPKRLELPGQNYTAGSSTSAINAYTCISCMVNNGEDNIKDCFRFDAHQDDAWKEIGAINYPHPFGASTSTQNGDYYLIGGNYYSDEVARYKLGKWEDVRDLPSGRWNHAAAPLSLDRLVVCGGNRASDKSVADCVAYNVGLGVWNSTVGNLTRGRSSFQMVNFNGNVYAIGGFQALTSVERYDDVAMNWTEVKRLKHPRVEFVAVVV